MKSLIKVVSRLVPITSLGMLLAAAPTSTFAQAQSSSADWTQFLRDNMQRWNPYETVLGVNNAATLNMKWTYPTSFSNGIFDEALEQSSPAVVNGVVYVGSGDGKLYAFNASTGYVLWSFATGDFKDSSPAVANGVVYAGSADNKLYALNASTGALIWAFIGNQSGIMFSPTVVNGVVYVGSYDHNVYAVNAGTGALLWNYATGNLVESSPAVANGVVYVGSDDGNLYALNAGTGALIWSYNTGGPVLSSPAVANGVAYVGSFNGPIYALNASTGALIWSNNTGGTASSPAVANGVVYIGGGSYLDAFDASTGAVIWQYATGCLTQISSPALANGVVYVGKGDGVYGLNASTGAVLWSYAWPGCSSLSSPAITDGMVYIRGGLAKGANLYAFGLGRTTSADLFLRIQPTPTTVQQGDLITYAFPVWNLGPDAADQEVLNTQVPAGTTFDSISISGTPGLGTCTTPPYGGTGQIVCHENGSMAPNTTWTVRLTVKVTAAPGSTFTVNAATTADTPDPNLANNTAAVSTTVLGNADLFLRVQPTPTTVHQGDLLTYAFPVWNLGPDNAVYEVLNTQVPAGTTFASIRISGTPGLGTCTTPPYQGTGPILCHQNASMAVNATWTVRLTVKVTAPAGSTITESAATMSDTPDPNMANNTATAKVMVQ